MRFLAMGLAAAILAYLCYMGLMYFLQDSQVFPGRSTDQALLTQLRAYNTALTDLSLTTPDGAVLAGYLLPRTLTVLPARDDPDDPHPDRPSAPTEVPAPILLYFQGNAEEAASFFLWSPAELPRFTLAAVNYRGYGASTGMATEQTVKADALAVFDALRARYPGAPIAVMGRSIGSGVAAHVAANRPVSAVVLVTPYDSIRAVGQAAHPLLPVGLLLRQPFDVTPDAARVTAPTLFLIAANDTLIPPARAESLARVWAGPKDFRRINAGHNSILDSPDYWPFIRDFLTAVQNGAFRAPDLG
ncbi:alpha/beta hydrolase [Desulfolutivibrio sulfoxidireducens]|uniref:alpha/beta hydrolase n=1 Tax=Desulfolutivibrio sulfoxidireducens TaxID=2773299 RepID=UPI00159E09F6|nr:alpha/beta fold hydrolase [Desulfolutivibrio sulfoxidireducens]QLA17495.1 alpha/beta fold hydrolase [Desulfolutivibrio sulfoxidireducens]QLA21080.1 alpha/beta fold hydrolase [Desulfolutivibrio sulfoxidireducens]